MASTETKHETATFKGFAPIDTARNEFELWAQWYATHGRKDEEFLSERSLTGDEGKRQLKLVKCIDDFIAKLALAGRLKYNNY